MTKQDKLIALNHIRAEVIDKVYKERWEEVWFFPEYRQVPEVKGFLGTDPIFFVSINPSFGTFPSGPDLFYYRNLRRQGFGNAHLTDVFKVKCKNKNSKELLRNENLVQESKQILKKEIKVLSPKLIVGVGGSYTNFYRKIFSDYDIPFRSIPHYAPRFNNALKRKQFRRKLREIRKVYKRLSAVKMVSNWKLESGRGSRNILSPDLLTQSRTSFAHLARAFRSRRTRRG